MSGDGRLDLDELGDVIDHASTLDDAARAEVLDDGRGRSLGERLDDLGVTPWIRRHRVALASVTAVAVLVSAGVVAYRTLVPPPLDPDVRVAVSPAVPSQYVVGDTVQSFDQIGIFNTGTTLRSAYSLKRTGGPDTSTYTIVGLSGPGVRASSASRQPTPSRVPADEAAREDVDVLPDCFDDDVVGSTQDDFVLVVERTDERGRTVRSSLPLPAGEPSWGTFLTATCLQAQAQFGITAQSVTVAADRRTHVVRADVVVSNALALPTTVTVGPSYGITQVVPTMTTTALAARRGAVLPLDLEVRDCATAAVPFIALPSFPGSQNFDGGAPGVYLAVTFPEDVISQQTDPTGGAAPAQTPLTFTPAQTRVIDGAFRSLCDGAPTASIEVRDVGRAQLVAGVFPSGNAQSTRFPVTLDVRVAGADRLRVAAPAPLPDDSQTTRVASASAPVADGRATVRTWVDIDCQTGYAPPPAAQLEVTTPRGTFPLQVPVNDAALTASIARSCPELPLQQLLDFGWAAPA